MNNINKLKSIWADLYDPKKEVIAVVEEYFHPDYQQYINGVVLSRSDYISHVIAQKKNMTIHHIEYSYYLENGEELFALYYPKGKNSAGLDIEAEVIAYFQFRHGKLIKIHGQVRVIKGNFSDVDMQA